MNLLAIYYGHNASLAISSNGKVIYTVSEERYNQLKNYFGFPEISLKKSLLFLKKNNIKVDYVLFVDQYAYTLDLIIKKNFKTHPLIKKKLNSYPIVKDLIYKLISNDILNILPIFKQKFRERKLKRIYNNKDKLINKLKSKINLPSLPNDKFIFLNHHRCHAYSTLYFTDLKEDQLIFTLDGEGDEISGSVSQYSSGIKKMVSLSENSKFASLGKFYSEVTEYLGFKKLEHEFKIMGLAPYGDSKKISKDCDEIFYLSKDGQIKSKIVSNLFRFYIDDLFRGKRFYDIAAYAQATIENITIKWIEYWLNKLNIKNICLAGGIFMNISLCQKVSEISKIKKVTVTPSSSDESLVFGALAEINLNNNINLKRVENLYMGEEYKKDLEYFISSLDKNYKVESFSSYKELNEEASKLLKNGEVIGRCCGREEWGARGLGNRSIICDPSNYDSINFLNNSIKKRDFWMPFGPSILFEDYKNYLNDENLHKIDARFMTYTLNSSDIGQNAFKGSMHPINFKLRPQIISEENNKEYHDLIKKFKKLSGIGGVLNTSFNIHGLPNISDYVQAKHVMTEAGLKYIICENYLIKKIK